MRKPEYIARCHRCKVEHPIYASHNDVGVAAKFGDFQNNHRGHPCELLPSVDSYEGKFSGQWWDKIRRATWKPAYDLIRDAFKDKFKSNANVNTAFQAQQTMTITNFSSLATSSTAGWQSAQVDNTSNLFPGSLMQFTNTAVNTAAANSKALFFYAYGGNNSTDMTNFGAAVTGASEATLTFPDVTANPVPGLVYVQPYTTTNKAMVSLPFAMEAAFGYVLPSYWGVAAINHTGMTLGTVTMKFQGTYNTVV